MPENILAVVEQRQGKLNRVSWETLVAGQALAAETGWTLEAAVVGNNVGSIAGEVAGKKVTKVYSVESAKFEPYTPDAFAAGLKSLALKNKATSWFSRAKCSRANWPQM
jgi:electron transfer flavoprotein alpha subunit